MLSKYDAKMAQGLAILAMVSLHLFCRGDMPMYDLHLFIGTTPALYYVGLFGDICVPIYCICAGYAQILLFDREKERYRKAQFLRVGRFLCHFWLVVCLFSLVGLLAGDPQIPGSFMDLLGNLLLFDFSYNGAWWFVLTYILLVLSAPVFIRMVKYHRWPLVFLLSGGVYFVTYLLYFHFTLPLNSPIGKWIWEQLLLFGRSQFSFLLGMLLYRSDLVQRLRQRIRPGIVRYLIVIGIPAVLFLFHCVVQSLIVAPITGSLTLLCFHLWEKPRWAEKLFLFFGRHSANIWLTHMFFYATLFPGLVYVSSSPILVYLLMLGICVAVSYGIDWTEQGIKTALAYGQTKLQKSI